MIDSRARAWTSACLVSARGAPEHPTLRRTLLTGCWLTGAWIGGSLHPTALDPPLLRYASAASLAIPVALAFWVAAPRLPRARFVALLAGALVLSLVQGAAAFAPAPLLALEDRPGGLDGPWRILARVEREPAANGDGSYLSLRVESVWTGTAWESMVGRVEVDVPEPPPDPPWLAGSVVEAFVALRRDRPAANPGVPRLDRLALRGIDARARWKSYAQARLRQPRREGAATWSGRARIAVRAAIAERFPERAALVRALVLGERRDLEADVVQRMARTGLIHLLAISGLHVALFVASPIALLTLSGAAARVRIAGGLLAAALLPVLVIARAPVRRAATMAVILLAARLFGRRVSSVESLGGAVLCVVALDPRAALDRGLHLSVAATTALVAAASHDDRREADRSLRRGRVGQVARATFAAWFATAPLMALETRAVAPAALVLNPVAIPLVGVGLPLVLAAIGLTLVGAPLAAPTGAAADAALAALERLAALGQAAGPGLVPVPGNTTLVLCLAWISLAIALVGTGLRPAGLGGLVLASALAMRPPPPPAAAELIALDVGQGDALLLHAPDRAWLVDGGGFPGIDYDIGARVVAPQIRRRGIARLDAVVLSHPHADHAVGLRSVLEEIPATELWLGATPPGDRLTGALLDRAAAAGARALAIHQGIRARGGCRWRSLPPSPARRLVGGRTVDNDASLVLAAHCGGRSILFTGDAGVAAERGWPLDALRTGVLKVGHHGSAGSTGDRLIAAMRPRHALISVGARNPWGLPRTEVVGRLRAGGASVYRTDRDGAVTMRLGTRVRVRGERWQWGAPARWR